MVRRLQLLFILSAFLSFEVFKVFGSSKSLKANEDHLRHVDHHYQLSKSRIIIDDAISISQHRSLMNYINQDPILSQGEAFTLLSDGVTINKFALRNLYEIYRSVCVDFSLSKNGVVDESHRAERVLNYTSTKKYLVTMKTIIDVQLQILAYAESFFNRTLGIKGGTFFLRKKVKLERSSDKSPREVNNALGWLFPPHVDSCKFHEETWSCDHTYSEEEIPDFSKRNISAVLYLNELDVDMGGEFVFIDAPGRQVKHMSSGKISKQKRELLMNQGAYVSDYENYQSDYDSDLIPPPSHVEVRKAVEREKRKLAHRSSYSDNRLDVGDMSKLIKSIPVTENGLNYTIVKSKVRRLLIFNSSAENIHAVTQMVNKNDRRFTLFMFLYDKAEDNM